MAASPVDTPILKPKIYTPIVLPECTDDTNDEHAYSTSLIRSIASSGLEDANTSRPSSDPRAYGQNPRRPLSPAGSLGITADRDLENVTTTHVFRNLKITDDYYLNAVAWGPGNFAVGHDQRVTLMAETGLTKAAVRVLPTTLPPHRRKLDTVTSVAVSPDGTIVAAGTTMSMLVMFDAHDRRLLLRCQLNCGRIAALSFRPCGEYITMGTRRGSAITFSMARLLSIASRSNHRMVTGSRLIAGCAIMHESQAHDAEVCGVKWSHDGSYLATGGNDARVFIWKTPHLTPMAKPVRLVGHKAAVKAFGWSCQSPHYLATGGGSSDGKLRIWDVRTGAMLAEVATRSQLCSIAWSETADAICVGHGYSSNCVTLWEFDKFQGPSAIKQVGVVATHGGRVMFLGSRGNKVASGSSDGSIRVFTLFGAEKEPRHWTPDSIPLDMTDRTKKSTKKDLRSFFAVRTSAGLWLDPYSSSMAAM